MSVRRKTSRFPLQVVAATLVALTGLGGLYVLHEVMAPRFSDGIVQFESETPEPFTMPYFGGGVVDGMFHLQFTMHVPSLLRPQWYYVTPDDCIRQLWVNDTPVIDAAEEFCDLRGKPLRLGEYLHSGANSIRVELEDRSIWAIFKLRVDDSDPLMLAIRFFALSIIGGYIAFILRIRKAPRYAYGILLLCLAIAGFMKFYGVRTPYDVRAHDAGYHVEYVQYMSNNWKVPHAKEGWEYYQPPLYYALTAGMQTWSEFLGKDSDALLRGLQSLSWIIMCAALAACVWISTILFRGQTKAIDRILFVGLIGTLPSIVFLSSRINNDVLLYCFETLAIGLLLHWWQFKKRWSWYLACFVLALGLLVKHNMVILYPFAALLLAVAHGTKMRKKLLMGSVLLIVPALIAGWYFYFRIIIDGQQQLVGNVDGIMKELFIGNSLRQFVVFDPSQVLSMPFNNTWEDAARRQYFWEFVYRSMFFGEFQFPREVLALGSFILLLGMLCIPAMVSALRSHGKSEMLQLFPLALLGFLLVSSLLSFRLSAAYACNQDFRFIAVAMIPIAFFVLKGATKLHPAWRGIVHGMIVSLIVANVLFITSVLMN